MKRKVIINKETGIPVTVFDEKTEGFMSQLGEMNVERVSNIDFNNPEQKWQAVRRDNGELIVESEGKKKTYNDEADWANENLEELSNIYFKPEDSIVVEPLEEIKEDDKKEDVVYFQTANGNIPVSLK
jgi:flagellar basal body P-ring protein FlgI